MTLLAAPADALPESEEDEPAGDPSPAAPQQHCRRRLLLAVVAIAGVLAGAVGSAILVAVTFLSAAEDIGRGMSEGLGSVRETLATPRDAADDLERFTAVAPGHLGADHDLDALARSCYVGDLQSCDELWTAAPPLSDYEEYASTCGGRVKQDAVTACTELG
jgi:hypothetical protein